VLAHVRSCVHRYKVVRRGIAYAMGIRRMHIHIDKTYAIGILHMEYETYGMLGDACHTCLMLPHD
jgi:hypothetical protein